MKKTLLTEGIFLGIEVLFKLSLGLFIPIYFYFNRLPGIDYGDRLIMCFAGGYLIYTIDFEKIYDLIRKNTVSKPVLKA